MPREDVVAVSFLSVQKKIQNSERHTLSDQETSMLGVEQNRPLSSFRLVRKTRRGGFGQTEWSNKNSDVIFFILLLRMNI